MKLSKYFLIGVGALTLVFGLGYLLSPGAMTDPAGFGSLSAGATTDVRATYGGFQIGMGIFLIWTGLDPSRFQTGLVLIALSIGAVFACRVFGVLVDGELSAFHSQGLIFEATLTALSAFVATKQSRALRAPVATP